MDAKKLAGVLIAIALAVPIIATASPGTLGLIDIGLIGLLYFVRRRRSAAKPSRAGRLMQPRPAAFARPAGSR